MGKWNAFVVSNGCPESLNDGARVRRYLLQNGWEITHSPSRADLILFGACGRSEGQAARSLSAVRWLRRSAPGARLIVWGCLAKIDPERIGALHDGPSFGEGEMESLDNLLSSSTPIDQVNANDLLPSFRRCSGATGALHRFLAATVARPLRRLQLRSNVTYHTNGAAWYIKVCTGCLGRCAYCAIRLARGTLRSKSVDDVLAEFRRGLQLGATEFVLLGTDVSAYGLDREENLADLLGALAAEPGDFRISLRNVQPRHLAPMLGRLRPILASGMVRQVELAVESGSDSVLRRMNRGYTTEDVRACVHALRWASPGIVVRAQMMVGFPSETWPEFRESIRILGELRFDWTEVYRFSPRPGTAAWAMEGRVPGPVAALREGYMRACAAADSLRRRNGRARF